MKTVALSLFMLFSRVAFCQQDTLKGTIKVKKQTEEIDCFVTVLGYGKDDKFLRKKDVSKIDKIELNKGCDNYEVVSFELSYNQGGTYVSEVCIGNTLKLNGIKNLEELTNIYIENIIVKDVNSGFTKKIPSIIFKIID
ncbi:MAG: hypothetical protein WBM13_01995 [Bacteroidia bacterium]